MTKETYLNIRDVMGVLAAFCAAATVFLPVTIANSSWAMPIALALSLVCAIYCMLKSAGAEMDCYMYPEYTHLHNSNKALFYAAIPVMATALMLAFVVFGTLLNPFAILMACAHFILVLVLSSGYIYLLSLKYSTEGEAWYKAKAMTRLDAVMATLGIAPADQQAMRASLADKTANDVYTTADALEDLYKVCPAALGAKTQQPSQP